MRILYVAMAHEYGRPELGGSFEEMNFRSALEGMGHEVVPFDFKVRELAVGRATMRRELVARAAEVDPALIFFFLFQDELDPDTIRAAGRAGAAPTMNWFADDHWRFGDFTRHLAPALDWSITTDHDALPKYRALGCPGAILSQWACNRYAYDRRTTALEHDVTFVGQPHSDRRAVVAAITATGHRVECWGDGWPLGRIGHDDMVRLFGASAINLNLSNSSLPQQSLRARVGRFVRRQAKPKPRPSQIKGRTFEVPGSGGFLLTDCVPHLDDYFELEREVAVFTSTPELIERIGWWLEHPAERAALADAGYRRVMAEHTYDHRFRDIFARAGLA